jgi:hypothetical protein
MSSSSSSSPWLDLTSLILTNCSSLLPGQMVFGPDFRLHDSMSAIELMEPKMDGGLAENLQESLLTQLLSSGALPSCDEIADFLVFV